MFFLKLMICVLLFDKPRPKPLCCMKVVKKFDVVVVVVCKPSLVFSFGFDLAEQLFIICWFGGSFWFCGFLTDNDDTNLWLTYGALGCAMPSSDCLELHPGIIMTRL